jgi:parallel beta-helix repeat protein
MKNMKLGMLFLAGYALSGGVANAATYYVAQDGGSNNYTCAQAQAVRTPKLTVTAGIGCLAAGDTLLVRAGTYRESLSNFPSGTSSSNRVRIAAFQGETVWLKPPLGNWVIYYYTQAFTDFDGINVDGTSVGDASIFFEYRDGENPNHNRILNAEVHHREGVANTNAAITVGGTDNEFLNLRVHGTGGPYGFYLAGSRNIVDGCDIYHTSLAGIQIYKNGGNPTGNIVRNTKIHDITDSSFFGAPDPRMWGIIIFGTDNQFYNNTIYGINFPYQSGNAAISLYGGSGTKVWNNTIYNNTTEGITISGTVSAEVRNNIIYKVTHSVFNNAGSGTVQSNNLMGVDPLFVNEYGNDFQLQGSSPAVNAGMNVSGITTDMAGVPRPQGSAADIGAYEYHTAATPATPPAPPANYKIVSSETRGAR